MLPTEANYLCLREADVSSSADRNPQSSSVSASLSILAVRIAFIFGAENERIACMNTHVCLPATPCSKHVHRAWTRAAPLLNRWCSATRPQHALSTQLLHFYRHSPSQASENACWLYYLYCAERGSYWNCCWPYCVSPVSTLSPTQDPSH